MTKNNDKTIRYMINQLIVLLLLLVSHGAYSKEIQRSSNSVSLLLNEMYQQSPALQAYRFRKQSVEEAYQEALWQRYPTPKIGMSQQAGEEPSIRISLEQPIWTGGNITHSINMERSRIDSATADIESVKVEIATEFINILGEWISAYQKKNAYLRSSLIYEDLEDTIKRRAMSGVSSDVDVLLIESRKRALMNDILKEENNLIIKSQMFSSMLGRKVFVNDLIGYGFGEPLEQLPESQLPEMSDLIELINNHPRIKKLNKDLVTQQFEYSKERSSKWPKVSLELRYEHNENNLGFINKDTGVYLNLTSNWTPGLSSFTSHNKIESLINSTKSEKDAQIQRLTRLYTNDYLSYDVTLKQIENTLKSIQSAKSVYDSYKRQYLVGKKTWNDLLNAAQDVIKYEVQLAEFYSVKFISRWRLELLKYSSQY